MIFKQKINNYIPIYAIEIIIGIVLKQIFNDAIYQVKFGNIINIVYDLAIMLIMFFSGYESNIFQKNYKNIKYKKDTVLLLLMFYIISFCLSLIFIKKYDNKILGIILMTITIASTFAGVVIPLIKDLKLINSNINNFIIYFISISELLSIALISLLLFIIDFSIYKVISYILLIIIFIMILFAVKKNFLINNSFIIIVVLIICSLITNIDGGELILGSFLLGLFLKYHSLKKENILLMKKVTSLVFMPIFFIFVGMKVDINNYINEPEKILNVLLLVLVIIISKIPLIYINKKYQKLTIYLLLIFACTLITSLSVSHLGTVYYAFSESFAEDIIFASIIVCIISGVLSKMLVKNITK